MREETTTLLRCYFSTNEDDTIQEPKIQWYQTYGGNATDIVYAFIPTVGGGFALAGSISSFGLSTWRVKTDANGIVQWNQFYKKYGI